MNSDQRITLTVAGIFILLLCIFPPYEIAYPLSDAFVLPSNSLERTFQRAFIFQKPQLTPTSFEIEHPDFASFRVWNTQQLFFECLLVLGIAGALLLVLSDEFKTRSQSSFTQQFLVAFLIVLFGVGVFLLWFSWLGYLVSFLLRLALVLILLTLLILSSGSFRNVARKGAAWTKGLVYLELLLVCTWVVSSIAYFWGVFTASLLIL